MASLTLLTIFSSLFFALAPTFQFTTTFSRTPDDCKMFRASYCPSPELSTPFPKKFPAIFILGDSVMDTGNNNYIPTWLQANYLPYGQNYKSGVPTGRFSNGILISDMLTSFLGIKDSLPPFLDRTVSNDDLVMGVNFASVGSGFDDLTSVASKAISVSQQIESFKVYITRLKGIVGEEKAMEIVSSSFVVLSAGSNDWFFNYYDIPTRRLTYDISGYQDFLLNLTQNFIKELHEIGCLSIMVTGLAPTGCFPFQKELKFQDKCIENQDKDSIAYNTKLVNTLSRLRRANPGIKLVYNDLYTPIAYMLQNPKNYAGLAETTKGCCDNELSTCKRIKAETCKNPDQYLFWDGVHPTLAAYNHIFSFMVKNVLPQFL